MYDLGVYAFAEELDFIIAIKNLKEENSLDTKR